MRLPVSKQASANAARAALHRLSTVAAVMAAAETAIAANGRGLWDRWRARTNAHERRPSERLQLQLTSAGKGLI